MIIISILKVLGIIILSILGLVVFLLLLVLFYPLHYKIKGNSQNTNIVANGKVTWLFGLLGYYVDYDDEGISSYYRVLFFKKKKDEDISEEDLEEENYDHEVSEDMNLKEDAPVTEQIREETSKKEASEEETPEEETPKEETIKKSSKKKKLKGKKNALLSKFNKIKDFLSDEDNKRALSHLKKELICLLKAINPYKLMLTGSFSTGSPDTTGQVTGILALFPIVYKRRWRLYPDFESDKFYVDSEFDIRGNIYLFKLVGIVIRLLIDKDCRKLYNDIMN